MFRLVLVTITDIIFCPAPDCTFDVISNGYANCPELKCLRPDFHTSFCKQQCHPNITCEY
jgi:E3 ubiquitin-protein ligase RNF19A